MSPFTLTAFEQTLTRHWAEHFRCPIETVAQPGTTVLPEDKYTGDNLLALWYIGQHTFVQLDPAIAPRLTLLLAALPVQYALSGADLQSAWGEAIKARDAGLAHYLYPPDLPTFAPAPPFTLRQLTLDDGDQMTALHNANTPADVEEGFVEVTHEIAFGCFAGDQLVAASSGYRRTGFMDIGVLTHPQFRRKGLGKAVVGAVCEWSAKQGVIAQYRCNATNHASHSVAQALNFRLYFKSESVWLQA